MVFSKPNNAYHKMYPSLQIPMTMVFVWKMRQKEGERLRTCKEDAFNVNIYLRTDHVEQCIEH